MMNASHIDKRVAMVPVWDYRDPSSSCAGCVYYTPRNDGTGLGVCGCYVRKVAAGVGAPFTVAGYARGCLRHAVHAMIYSEG